MRKYLTDEDIKQLQALPEEAKLYLIKEYIELLFEEEMEVYMR